MVNCAIFASLTEAALTGDRFPCIEACHASFPDACQCTVALKAPEMVLRAPHTTLVHALFLLLRHFHTSAICTVQAQPESVYSRVSREECQRGTHVVSNGCQGTYPPVSQVRRSDTIVYYVGRQCAAAAYESTDTEAHGRSDTVTPADNVSSLVSTPRGSIQARDRRIDLAYHRRVAAGGDRRPGGGKVGGFRVGWGW
jgi:hypothetical protein